MSIALCVESLVASNDFFAIDLVELDLCPDYGLYVVVLVVCGPLVGRMFVGCVLGEWYLLCRD